MGQVLILVESPSKAKKIQGLLGPTFRVRATLGHICDLPAKEYGVDLATMEEVYEVRKPQIVTDLRGVLRSASWDQILLATDPDREGEAIAWHVVRELKLSGPKVQRVEFHEITEKAIRTALAQAHPLNYAKVGAARARRVLDRIVGFDVSREICWPAGAQSAGRVQTPALHILCERERLIRDFVPDIYFTLEATYTEGLLAFVPDLEASVKDTPEDAEDDGPAEDDTDRKSTVKRRRFRTEEEAAAVRDRSLQAPHRVESVATTRKKRTPPAPYKTSTLQSDASRKLGISARDTMTQAQTLFEQGFITYHRTDSERLSADAMEMARAFIEQDCPAALPDRPPRQRKGGAQDAHEAIRPTHLVGDDQPPKGTFELYQMIKARFLASQCRHAEFDHTAVQIQAGDVPWYAEGSAVKVEGFLHYWAAYLAQQDLSIPQIREGATLTVDEIEVRKRQTSPPSRYDTGSLTEKLEKTGVGRPSTFATIIDTLLHRGYVVEDKSSRGRRWLIPTDFGLQVDGLLTESFPDLVLPDYTASMETSLDQLEADPGAGTHTDYLFAWHQAFQGALQAALPRAEAYRTQHGLRARATKGEPTDIRCDRCAKDVYLKVARRKGKGTFLACPSCGMTRDVRAKVRPGACKKCGGSLLLRKSKKGKGSTFWGCVNYGAEPTCDYVEWEDGASPKGASQGRFQREVTEKTCPKCEKEKLALLTPRDGVEGSAFYACTRECGFRLNAKARRRREPCPQCGGMVTEVMRRGTDAKDSTFWGCAKFPDCSYTAPKASS